MVFVLELAEKFLQSMLSVGDFLFNTTIDVSSNIDAVVDKVIGFFGDSRFGEFLSAMHVIGGGHLPDTHNPAFYLIGNGLILILSIKFTKFIVGIIKG